MGSSGRVHTGGRRRAQLILHTQLQKLQWRHDKRYNHVKHTAHSPKSLIVHKMFRRRNDDEAEIMRRSRKVELFWLVNAYLQETVTNKRFRGGGRVRKMVSNERNTYHHLIPARLSCGRPSILSY